MVYIDPEELKWLPYVKSWLARLSEKLIPADLKDFVLSLFEYAVENGFVFIKKQCQFSINQVNYNVIGMYF